MSAAEQNVPGKNSIAILGAGFGGMSAAYDLARAGKKVTIFEASEQTGGLASGFKEPHWEWSVEKFYHHWFASDHHILGLITELGWQDKVIFKRPYTVVYWKDRFYPFDSIFSNIPLFILRRFPLPDAIRYGLAGAYLRFSPWWKSLENVTAAEWTRRRFGQRVYDLQWRPLLISKFGEENANLVNMAWLWARLHSRTTRLGTFQGGFQAFADAFAERLRSLGVTVHLSTPVDKITPQADGKLLLEGRRGAALYDQCLATTSPASLARLATDLPQDYLMGLLGLKHMGAVVMILALKQQLSEEGYYWFNLPKAAGFPYLALVEHTNFLSPEYFGGNRILYMGDYLETNHEYFNLSQEELLARFLPGLTRFNSRFSADWVRKSWLFRTQYAQPVPLINHSQKIPAIQTPIPGLFLASMSQVYPWDRGTNFAVEIGRRAAQLMLANVAGED